jgi:predicted short-subunit dehydrogenase-like oxidoreductase (DUF2520 family)
MMCAPIMKTLNLIGAGRVGRTLAALWRQQAVFDIQCVLNRTLASAGDAVKFIGAGRAVSDLGGMTHADVWLLAPPDSELVRATENLSASGLLRVGDLVFHCSGAMASGELKAVTTCGAHVASVHPLKSFADAQDAVRTFGAAQGTYCTAEGDAAALAVLKPAFEKIGARVMEIDPRYKTIYHAASVMVCNDLTALMEAGLQCYAKAGLPRETAGMMMEPLVRETVDNVFRLGTVRALTGPIARGDHAVVARQLDALREFDPRIAEIYRALGVMALALSRLQGAAREEGLAALERVLHQTAIMQRSNQA